MKKLYLVLSMLLVVTVVAACESTRPQTPEQALFALDTSFNGALAAAVAYESLERCDPAKEQPICSKPNVVEKLRNLGKAGDSVLTVAEDLAISGDLSSGDLEKYIIAISQIITDMERLAGDMTNG